MLRLLWTLLFLGYANAQILQSGAWWSQDIGKAIVLIGGSSGGGFRPNRQLLQNVDIYDPRSQLGARWGSLPGLASATSFHATCVTEKEELYVSGGSTGFIQASMFRYEKTQQTWIQLSSMNNARYLHGMTAVGSYLYAVGGYSSQDVSIASVERYDPSVDQWTEVASMQQAVSATKAVTVGTRIYVPGGWSGGAWIGSSVSTLQVYDTVSDAWTFEQPMPQGVWGAGVEAVGRKIYVAGGATFGAWDAVNTLQEYDTVTQTWTMRSSMSTARLYHGTAALGRHLYVFGGVSTYSIQVSEVMFQSVERYDFETDSWEVFDQLAQTRTDFTATRVALTSLQ